MPKIAVHIPTVVQRFSAISSGSHPTIFASLALVAGTALSRTSNML
jgi:hypothetical protein